MIALRATADGIVIPVHVTPGAKKTKMGGEHDGALRISVNSPPVDGKANQAVIEALAEALGIRRNQCEIVQGQTSRRKTILVRGVTMEAVVAILNAT